MNTPSLSALAVPALLLAFGGTGLWAQSSWPPDEDDPPYTQQPGYPTQQPGYPPQQPGYADPGYSQQQAYGGPAYPQPNYEYGGQTAPAYSQPQPMTPEQLEQVLAPIALYPDALLAQILTASTYPAEVVAADQWLRGMGNASPEQIAAGANAQTAWDPSVKALTAYPQVLQMLAGNLQWTSDLGNVYYNQPQDVLQTVQVLRQRAEEAGNLQSTPQQEVIQEPGYIALQPPSPEVVYVPTYNPWAVYGTPIAPYPGFAFVGALGDFVGTGLQFGLSFGVAAFQPFGLLGWGLDWLGGAVLFHDAFCWSHSREVRDWGFAHGGSRYWGGRGGGWGGGRQMARFGDYQHQGIPVHGGQGGFPPARPGGPSYGRGAQGFNRGYQRGTGQPLAYSHAPSALGRPQPYGGRPQTFARGPEGYRPQAYGAPRSPYGGGSYPRAGGGYPTAYGRVPQGYRSPQSTYGAYGGGLGRGFARPSAPYSGSYGGYSRGPAYGGGYGSQPRSGGFHAFGGNHSNSFGGGRSPSWGGGGHSPSFGGGHSFSGGGHSFFGGGGGHSFGGGGHSFSGGGGHSFGGGGGHSFGGGGGHSFGGGHSSGGGGGHSHGHR